MTLPRAVEKGLATLRAELPVWPAFACCWLLSLLAIWVPHFPVGVDLPQHANLLRMWADLRTGDFELRRLYHENLFTPYLLPYFLALLCTYVGGALAATKCLLTFAVLATPWYLTRWLRAIGAAPAFGLVGFVVTFDYCYLWGFISCTIALALMFAYLAEFEAQGDAPSAKQVLKTTALAVALFFSHGITFGIALAISGMSWVLRGRWVKRVRALLHIAPVAALTATWLALRHKEASADKAQQFFDKARAEHLFSGAFTTFPDDRWAMIGAAGVAIFLLLARPKLTRSPARWLPFLLSTAVFVAMPDIVASTWYVATRFCVFIHALAPAVLVPRESDPVARRWPWVLLALVAAFLVTLNVRLARFNHELDGFRTVAALIPPGSDVQTLVPETESTDPVFGPAEFGQIPAWVTAQQGGLIANDSAIMPYYQMPIRRSEGPMLARYPYVIAHGSYARLRGMLHRLTMTPEGPARLIKESDDWVLLRRPYVETPDFTVIRYGQGWGDLHVDRNVDGGPLNVGADHYEHGFGTHATSLIRLRLKHSARLFVGACGIDAAVGNRGHAVFRVRRSNGDILFDSGPMNGGESARPFGVEVANEHELVLEADGGDSIDYAHADWVNLSLH